MAEKILRRREVEARTGLARSTIYKWLARNDFPAPIALGARMVGWRERDVEAWLAARPGRAA